MSCDSNKDQVKKERTNRISSYDRLIELNMILLSYISHLSNTIL
jgi:hypothetical protein